MFRRKKPSKEAVNVTKMKPVGDEKENSEEHSKSLDELGPMPAYSNEPQNQKEESHSSKSPKQDTSSSKNPTSKSTPLHNPLPPNHPIEYTESGKITTTTASFQLGYTIDQLEIQKESKKDTVSTTNYPDSPTRERVDTAVSIKFDESYEL